VAGPVRREEILRLAEKHFGAFPTGQAAVEIAPPPFPKGPRFEATRHDESQSELRFTFPAPPDTHPDFPALLVLRRILDDGLSSRLQVNIVDRRGLAYSVQAGFDTFVDTGLFEVDLACAHAKLPAAAEALLETLGEIATTTVPEDELQRAKTRFRIGFDFMRDSASELAGWYGGIELFQSMPAFDERIARVDAVTGGDVLRVARQMLRRSQLLACMVGKADAKGLRSVERLLQDGAALPA
jgi:predicted Zn-dependent peptidase